MATEDPSVVRVLDQTHEFHRSSHEGDHGWTARPTPTAVSKRRRHGWSVEDVDYDPFRPCDMEESRAGSTRPELPPEYGTKIRFNEKFDPHRAYSGDGRDLQNGISRIQLQRLGPLEDGSRLVLSSPVEGVKNSSRISTHAGRPDHISQKNVSPLAAPAILVPCKETVGLERDASDAGAAAGDNHENGWFYCNAYNYFSGPFTLEILREGFNVSFLPGELVVYYRQDGVYSAPQELKMLIDATTVSSQFVNSSQQVKTPRNLYVVHSDILE